MKAGKRRYWIAFLAAIFLSGKVAAAVELCLHDMSQVGTSQAAEALAGGHDHGSHSEEDCCDAETGVVSTEDGDCCSEIGPEPPRLVVHCIAGGASLESAPLQFRPLPYPSWTVTLPAQPPPLEAAGPSLTILFRNLRR